MKNTLPTTNLANRTRYPSDSSHVGTNSLESVANVPDHSESFGIIPHRSTRSRMEIIDSECTLRKQRSDSLQEKISPADRSRLFEWLAQHSYTEVQELVAVPPPEGFGFTVAKSSQFYKAYFRKIDSIRQLRLDARAYAISRINQDGDYAQTSIMPRFSFFSNATSK